MDRYFLVDIMQLTKTLEVSPVVVIQWITMDKDKVVTKDLLNCPIFYSREIRMRNDKYSRLIRPRLVHKAFCIGLKLGW